MEAYIFYISKYFILLLIYSFCGWSIETTGEYIKSRKFVNRGFLLGPICPIYGIGALLITIFLSRYYNDIFAIFGLSAIMCGALEYLTSYLMEKIFKARWWDYSNQKLNINGRICLETIVLFAIAGIIIIEFMSPLMLEILQLIPDKISLYASAILFIIFLADVIVSFNVMNKIKNVKESVANNFKDNTEEISTRVREILLEKSLPYRRILEAFPQAFADKVKESKEMLVQAADMIKTNVQEAKEKVYVAANNAKVNTARKMVEIQRKRIRKIAKRRYIIKKFYYKKHNERKSGKQ